MQGGLGDALRAWHDFYLLIGTASGTLIGLLFVAASVGTSYFTAEHEAALKAFLTPTVLHFTAVLTSCLVATAPSHTPMSLGVLMATEGVLGVGYAAWLWLHMRRRGFASTIDLADRGWYVFAPFLAYLLMVAAGVDLARGITPALDLLAATLVLLLLIGIRNAWDMTVWIVIRSK
ncbi:MAG TPA: hypothetical protein VE397_20105 [Stellaceae bacterium]|nr:hypothetical protein [Stellaceae bacterium]